MAEKSQGDETTPTRHAHVERRRRPSPPEAEPEAGEEAASARAADAVDAAPAAPTAEADAVDAAPSAPDAVDAAPAAEAPEPEAAQPAAPPAEAEPAASFADLFDGSDVPRASARLSVGTAVEGPVVHVGNDGVFVDAGGHQQAFYPRAELLDARGALTVGVGDVVRGHVVRMGDDGTAELGGRLSSGMSVGELEIAMQQELQVEGKVVGVNRGGVSVDLGGVRAFCPIGQLDRVYVADASVFLQQTLRFEVIEVKGGKDVVLSRKRILEREAEASRESLLAELKVGDQRVGTVMRVRDFGAFVELAPGIDGLIPTRELSHDRRRADQVVSAGQTVEVKVQEISQKDGDTRITLSLKALGDDPWDAVDRVASPGQVAQGVVRRLMDFGAFIELAPGIEGLMHVSELGGGARHPNSSLSVGEPVLVTVQSVDPERQRISLAPAPQGASAGQRIDGNQPQVGDIVKAVVDRVEPYGVFVQIEGIPGRAGRGLIHERELGLAHGVDAKKAFPAGKEVQAKVIATGKLALSIKAIDEDEARREVETYKASQASSNLGTLGDLLKGLKK